MGIHDRDYYRQGTGGTHPLVRLSQSAVRLLITITVAMWFLQLLGGPVVTSFLSASAREVFGGHIYKIVTANFAHSERSVFHILWNMLFLYFFGRELEQIYGRRDFLILYLLAGSVAVLAEVIARSIAEQPMVPILGASGAVMGVVVLYALFYPHRQILFMFFLPMPVWLLCVIFVGRDLLAALSGAQTGVAHIAHLSGAAVGFAYWYFDLRWRRWGHLVSRWRLQNPFRRRQAKIIRMPRRPSRAEVDRISRRIDQLLAKISSEGKESLTEEEWRFLKENSARYRS